MTAVIRACVAGAMAGVVLATTCSVGQPSLAAAQNAAAPVGPPATPAAPAVPPSPPSAAEATPPPAAAPVDQVPPPSAAPAPAQPEPIAPPPPEAPAPGATFAAAPPPAGLAAAPEPNAFASEATESEAPSKIPSYVLWGAGGASLIVGAVFGGLALSAKSDFNAAPSYDRADTVDHRALAADVAFGLGIVLAVTGTVFFFTHEAPAPTQARLPQRTKAFARLSVLPLLAPRVGGGAVRVQF